MIDTQGSSISDEIQKNQITAFVIVHKILLIRYEIYGIFD